MALMPQGLVRIQQSRQSHFVTISCYRREARLADEGICRAFLDSLKCVRSTRGLRVDGYVRMPEHVHLLLSEPERGLLCGALQALKISLVRRPGGGRLWQRRYYDRNVSHHAEFVEKLRYIHRNPLVRGLCAQPEEWPWSSFRHYLTAQPGVVEIESEWTALRRAGREPNPMKLAAVSAPTSAKCRQIWGHPQPGDFRCGPPAFLHSILNIRYLLFSLQTSSTYSGVQLPSELELLATSQRWRRCFLMARKEFHFLTGYRTAPAKHGQRRRKQRL